MGEKEGYRFGVRGAWLLAPTRHGAHNWEGAERRDDVPGRRAASARGFRSTNPLLGRFPTKTPTKRVGAGEVGFARFPLARLRSALWFRDFSLFADIFHGEVSGTW